MPRSGRLKLSFTFAAVGMAAALVLGLASGLFQVVRDYTTEKAHIAEHVTQILEAARRAATPAAHNLDDRLASEIVAGLIDYGFIKEAVIVTDIGTELAAKMAPELDSDTRWITRLIGPEFSFHGVELRYPGDPSRSYGTLTIIVDNDRALAGVYERDLLLVGAELASSVLLALILFGAFHFWISRPLKTLVRGFESINPEERGSARLPIPKGHGNDELGKLAKTANQYLEASQRNIADRERTEIFLRETEERFRDLANNVSVIFWIGSRDWKEIFYISPAYEEIWGRSCESLLAAPQSWMKAVHEDDQDGVTEAIAGATGRDWSEVIFPEYRIVRPNGDIRWIQARAFPARDGTGEIARVVGIAEDITDHKNMERQLLHAQKMEAVGQLTGGIAHDFNNLLQVIESNLDVLAKHPGLDKDSSILVSRALDAGRRGANLTRHLLAFSRRQLLHPAVVEPNELIGGWVRILTRTLGEDVAIETRLADSLPSILVDPGGLESALLNLALNARAAMANGGTLTISTAEIERGKTIHADGRSLPAGKYVEIAIADTGCGIPDEILERVFEPFFTTKEVGEGSGLGLSMVYGFVRQSRGDVGMTSKPGSGTTVRMVFPAAEPGSAKTAEEAGSRDLDIEHDTLPTVLVVEDEPSVRDSTVTILESLGLRVVAVGDGHEALEALSVNGSIGLMITDMVMPKGLDGLQLARKATRHTPDLRVIIATGYPEPHRKTEGMAESGFVLLNKPYKVNDLIAALDRVWTGAPDP